MNQVGHWCTEGKGLRARKATRREKEVGVLERVGGNELHNILCGEAAELVPQTEEANVAGSWLKTKKVREEVRL